MDALVDRYGPAAAGVGFGHGLDVTAGAERPAGPGQHDGAHVGVGLEAAQHGGQTGDHGAGQGVAPLRPVHGQDPDAVLDAGQEVGCSGVDVAHIGPFYPVRLRRPRHPRVVTALA